MSGLSGQRVLNTRAIEQQATLDHLLEQHGAIPISFPCIRFEPLDSTVDLDAELRHAAAGGYAWLLVTSANTAAVIEARLQALGLQLSARVGAVGHVTAAAVERWLGQSVEIIPDDQSAAALAASLPIAAGDHVLIPASSKARTELAEGIRKRGGNPRVVTAYQTVATGPSDVATQLGELTFDAVAFASPSTVEGFVEHLRSAGKTANDFDRIAIGCIGPATFQAAQTAGFSNAIHASTFSLDGLITALEQSVSAIALREASSTL